MFDLCSNESNEKVNLFDEEMLTAPPWWLLSVTKSNRQLPADMTCGALARVMYSSCVALTREEENEGINLIHTVVSNNALGITSHQISYCFKSMSFFSVGFDGCKCIIR